jgi:hypothetical protein
MLEVIVHPKRAWLSVHSLTLPSRRAELEKTAEPRLGGTRQHGIVLQVLAFGETSFDSLLLPLLLAGASMAAVRVAVRVCRGVTRARDARLIARASETRVKPSRNS